MIDRRLFLLAAGAAAAGSPGDWDVHHRRQLPDGSRWVEFDGTCSNRPLIEGYANMEEHYLAAPTGSYRALGLRSYDPATRQWAVRWFDQRFPRAPIDPPDRGVFRRTWTI